MRILIADESTATSKPLRPYFAAPSRSKSAGKTALAAGQLMVSCGPTKKAARGKQKDDDCSCTGLDLGDQPEQASAILDALGIALLNRGCLEQGAKLIELALQIRRKAFGHDHPLTAASQNSFARVQRERGDYDSADKSVRTALQINRAVYGGKGYPVAISLYELGVIQLQQGLYPAAEQSAIEGLEILSALGLLVTDPNTTRLMDVRGRAEAGLGKLTAADKTYTDLLKLDLKQLGHKNHPKYATHLANYGLVLEAMRQFRPAEAAYRNAIDLYYRSLNRRCHPNLIDSYANLGSLLRTPPSSPKKLSEAGTYLKRALELGLKVRGNAHALVGNDYANLGRWQYDTGNPREAGKSFSAASQTYARSVKKGGLPANHFYIAETQTWRGRVLVEQNTEAAARQATPLLRDAVAIWPVQLGAGTAGEGVAMAYLGRSLHLEGDTSGAACTYLCNGYAIIKAKVTDVALIKRVEGWIAEQGCNCGPTTPPSKRAS